MRCHICNKILSEPTWNSDHKDFNPCDECLEIIQGLLAQHQDRPSMDEDEFFEEISLSELGPYFSPSAGHDPEDFT